MKARAAVWRILAVSAVLGIRIGPASALVKADPARLPAALTGERALPLPAPIEVASFAAAGASWQGSLDLRSGRPALLWGRGPEIPAGVDAAGAVREVLAAAADLAGLEPVLAAARSGVFDGGRLRLVDFDLRFEGVPVLGSRAYARINHGRIVQLGFDRIVSLSAGSGRASLAPEDARRVAEAALGLGPEATAGEPRLVFLPRAEDRSGGYTAILVWDLLVRSPGGEWRARIDARGGDVVELFDARRWVSGKVEGMVYPRTLGQTPVRVPFALQRVQVGNGSVLTDGAGSYSSAKNGSVVFTLDGLTPTGGFRVVNSAAGSAMVTVTTPGPVEDLLWDFGNSMTSERNTFWHLHQGRFAADTWISPAWFGSVVPASVEVPGFCNAYWDGTGVNFFPAGNGCNNSGEIADVIMHEWGHGLDENHGGIFDSAGSEGLSDVVAWMVTRSPLMGPGFLDPPTAPFLGAMDDPSAIRDASKLVARANIAERCPLPGPGCGGPLGYECHCEGLVLSGAMWDLKEALVARYGDFAGWPAAERLFFVSIPAWMDHTQTADALLATDDDNANLFDGTPNACLVWEAFDRHGTPGAKLPCSSPFVRPAFVSFAIDDAMGDGDGFAEPGERVTLPLTLTNTGNAAGTGIRAVVSTTAPGVTLLGATADFAPIAVGAQVGSSGSPVTVMLDPSIPCGTLLRFEVSLEHDVSRYRASFELVAGKPGAALLAQSFDAGAGGFAGNTGNASAGQWVAGVPRLTAQDGDVWQPGGPQAGAGCYFTGQNPSWNAIGSGDVDGGTSIALSPVIDLSAARDPVLQFWYWFTSSQVALQPADIFEVEVIDGPTVVKVFEERVSRSAWRFASVPLGAGVPRSATARVRFKATDDARAGNFVEAAIDELRVVEFECVPGTPCTLGASIGPVGPVALCAGDSALLMASVADCAGVPSFQWRESGVDLPGEVRDSYLVPGTLPAGSYSYDVVVGCDTQPGCSAASTAVAIAVSDAAAPAVGLNSLLAWRLGPDVNLRWTGVGTGTWNAHRTTVGSILDDLWMSLPLGSTPSTTYTDIGPAEPLVFYKVYGADCHGNSQK